MGPMIHSTVRSITDVGAEEREALLRFGIRSPVDLLIEAYHPLSREVICASTGIEESRLLRCLGIADLCRVPGVGSQTARLLFQADVTTASVLAASNAYKLTRRLRALNRSERVCRAAPGRATVAEWIEAARALAPGVEV